MRSLDDIARVVFWLGFFVVLVAVNVALDAIDWDWVNWAVVSIVLGLVVFGAYRRRTRGS